MNQRLERLDPSGQCGGTRFDMGSDPAPNGSRHLPLGVTNPLRLQRPESACFETGIGSRSLQANQDPLPFATMAEFVERKFIPEFVATKRFAGRAHFRALLKHVLPPEHVSRIFAENPGRAKDKLKTIPGWPYIDSLQLSEISPEVILHLTSAVIERGYSVQTATHIRNVIRSIFSYAIRTGYYRGRNPAAFVTLPQMNRKEAHSLNLVQLGDLLSVMMYPERDIALMSVLTDMSVAEICGLQWKYLNPSSLSHVLENDIIPPRTIAVRNQRFRGELSATVGNRRRLVRMPQLLCSHLLALKRRGQFTGPQDFVLVSRNGTPIHPENIAARRLKSIGKSFQMPWLSWAVFHRTRTLLRAELGATMHDEVGRLFAVRSMAPTPPRGYSQPTRDTRGLTLT